MESIFNFVGWVNDPLGHGKCRAKKREELAEQRVTAYNANCPSGAKCPSRVSVDGVEVRQMPGKQTEYMGARHPHVE